MSETAGEVTRAARLVFNAWLELAQRNVRFTERHLAVASGLPEFVVADALVELQVAGVLAPNPEGGYLLRAHPAETCPRCDGRKAVMVATVSALGLPLVGSVACPACGGEGAHAADLLGAFLASRG